MLTALGPDIEHLLNTVQLGDVSVPSHSSLHSTHGNRFAGDRPVHNL